MADIYAQLKNGSGELITDSSTVTSYANVQVSITSATAEDAAKGIFKLPTTLTGADSTTKILGTYEVDTISNGLKITSGNDNVEVPSKVFATSNGFYVLNASSEAQSVAGYANVTAESSSAGTSKNDYIVAAAPVTLAGGNDTVEVSADTATVTTAATGTASINNTGSGTIKAVVTGSAKATVDGKAAVTMSGTSSSLTKTDYDSTKDSLAFSSSVTAFTASSGNVIVGKATLSTGNAAPSTVTYQDPTSTAWTLNIASNQVTMSGSLYESITSYKLNSNTVANVTATSQNATISAGGELNHTMKSTGEGGVISVKGSGKVEVEGSGANTSYYVSGGSGKVNVGAGSGAASTVSIVGSYEVTNSISAGNTLSATIGGGATLSNASGITSARNITYSGSDGLTISDISASDTLRSIANDDYLQTATGGTNGTNFTLGDVTLKDVNTTSPVTVTSYNKKGDENTWIYSDTKVYLAKNVTSGTYPGSSNVADSIVASGGNIVVGASTDSNLVTIIGGTVTLKSASSGQTDLEITDGTNHTITSNGDALNVTISGGTGTSLNAQNSAVNVEVTQNGTTANLINFGESKTHTVNISDGKVTLSGSKDGSTVNANITGGEVSITGGAGNENVTIGTGATVQISDFGKAGTDNATIQGSGVTLTLVGGNVSLDGAGASSTLVFTSSTTSPTIKGVTADTHLNFSGIADSPTIATENNKAVVTLKEGKTITLTGTLPDKFTLTRTDASGEAISAYTFAKDSAGTFYNLITEKNIADTTKNIILGTKAIDSIDVESSKVGDNLQITTYAGADTVKVDDAATVNGTGAGENEHQYISVKGGSISGGNYGSTLIADGGQILGGSGDDIIQTKGDVTITGGSGSDSISRYDSDTAGKREIILKRGSGLDTIDGYTFSQDTIKIEGYEQKVTFKVDDSTNNATLSPSEDDDAVAVIVGGKTSEININGHIYQYDADEAKGFVERFTIAADNAIAGSSRSDSINNTADNVVINAGAGKDWIINSGNGVVINGEGDADSIKNSGTNVLINGGDGADSVWTEVDGVTVNGGADDDVIQTKVSNAVTIDGGAGNDQILISTDETSVEHHRYIIQSNGYDSIAGYDSGDTLALTTSINTSNFAISADNSSNVILTLNENNGVKMSLEGAADKVITTKNGSDVTEYYYIDSTRYGAETNGNFVTRKAVSTATTEVVEGTTGNDSIEVSADNVNVSVGTGLDWVTSANDHTSINALDGGTNILIVSGSNASISASGQNTIFSSSSGDVLIDLSTSSADNDVEIKAGSGGVTTIYSGKGADSITAVSDFSNGSFAAATNNVQRLIILDANTGEDILDFAANLDTLQFDTETTWTAQLVKADGTTTADSDAEKTATTTDYNSVLLTFGGDTSQNKILLTGAAASEITLKNGDKIEYIDFASDNDQTNSEHRFVNRITNATNDTATDNKITGIASANNSITNAIDGTNADSPLQIGTADMTGNNIVINNGTNVNIILGKGTDSVLNSVNNVTIQAGSGNDTITNTFTASDGTENISIVAGTPASGETSADLIKTGLGTIIVNGADTVTSVDSAASGRTISITGTANQIDNVEADKIYLANATDSDTNFALIGSDITGGIKVTTSAGDVSLTSDGTSLKYNINDKTIAYGDDANLNKKFVQVQTFEEGGTAITDNSITAADYTDSINATNATSDTKINLLGGNDILNIAAGQITLGGGSNSLDVSSSATITGTSLSGGVDTITAGDAAVSVKGGAGSMYVKLSNDSTLTGGSGDDTIYGGENRTIIISGGVDSLTDYKSGYNEGGAVEGGDTIIANLATVPRDWSSVIAKVDSSKTDVSIKSDDGSLILRNTDNKTQAKTIVLKTGTAETAKVAYLQFDEQQGRYVNKVQDEVGGFTEGADIATITGTQSGTSSTQLNTIKALGGDDNILLTDAANNIEIQLGASDNSTIAVKEGKNDYINLSANAGTTNVVSLTSGAEDITVKSGSGSASIINEYKDGNSYLDLSTGNNLVSLTGGSNATKPEDAEDATVNITLGNGANNVTTTSDGKLIRRYIEFTNKSSATATIDLTEADTIKGLLVTDLGVSGDNVTSGNITFTNASNKLITILDNATNANGTATAVHQYTYDATNFTNTGTFINVVTGEDGSASLVGVKEVSNSLAGSSGGTLLGGDKADILGLYGGAGSISAGSGDDTILAINDDIKIEAGSGTNSIIATGGNAVIDISSGSGTVYAVSDNASVKAGGTNEVLIYTGGGENGTINAEGGKVSITSASSLTYQKDVKGATDTKTYTAKGQRTIQLGASSEVSIGDYKYKNADDDGHDKLVFTTDDISKVLTPSLNTTTNDVEIKFGNDEQSANVKVKLQFASNTTSNKIVVTDNVSNTYTFQKDDTANKFVNYIDADATKFGTDYNDSIVTEQAMSITGGKGDDYIKSYGNATIDGGVGSDIIVNGGTATVVANADGQDTIYNYGENAVINLNGDILYSEAPNVSISAAAGTNTIVTSAYGTKGGEATINAAAGKNLISLDAFVETTWSTKQNGSSYNMTSGRNTGDTVKHDRLIILGSGSDNEINYAAGDVLTISGETTGDAALADVKIEKVENTDNIKISGDNVGTNILIDAAKTNTANNVSPQVITINDNTYQYNSTIGDVVHLINNPDDSDGKTDLSNIANSAIDSVNNAKEKATVDTGAGKDIIYNKAAEASINAGADDDIIESTGDNASLIAGAGKDTIIASGENVYIDVSGEGTETIFSSSAGAQIAGGNASIQLVSYSGSGSAGGDEEITLKGDTVESVFFNVGVKRTLTNGTAEEWTTADNTNYTLKKYNKDGTENSTANETWTYSATGKTLTSGTSVRKLVQRRTFYVTSETGSAVINDYKTTDIIVDKTGSASIQKPDTDGNVIIEFDKGTTKGAIKLTLKGVAVSEDTAQTVTIRNTKDESNVVETSYKYQQGQYYYVINNLSEGSYKMTVAGTSSGEIINNDVAGVSINGGGNNDIITNSETATGTTIVAGSNNDSITNYAEKVSILAAGGNNAILSTGDAVLVTTGAGDDEITIGGADSFSVDAGAGTNLILVQTYEQSKLGNQKGTANITLSGGTNTIRNIINDKDTAMTNGQNVTGAFTDPDDSTQQLDATAYVSRAIYINAEGSGTNTVENYSENDKIYFADAKNEVTAITRDNASNVTLTIKDSTGANTNTLKLTGVAEATDITINSTGTTNSKANDDLLFRYDGTGYRNVITTANYTGSQSLTAFDDSVMSAEISNGLKLSLGGGDDYIKISNGGSASLYAESGKNTIDATNFGYIEGGSGNDSINVSKGTGTGVVTINAGAGNDTITGDQKKVVIVGQADGADVIESWADGADVIESWADGDIISVNADYGIEKADSISVEKTTDGVVVKFSDDGQISLGSDAQDVTKPIEIRDTNGLVKKVVFDGSDAWNVITAENVTVEGTASINGTANHDSITATDINIDASANESSSGPLGDRIYATASTKDVSVTAGSGNDSIVATGTADHKITVNSGLGDDTVDGAYRILQIEGNKTSNLLVQNFNSAQDTLQIIDNADDVTGISYTDVKVTAATRSSDGKEVYLEVGASSEHITLQSASAIDDTIGITDKAGNVVRTLQYNSSLDKFINIIDNVVVTDSDGNKVITGTSDIDSIRVATADVTVKDENTANNIVSIESAASNAVINLSSGADSIYAGAANASINAGGGADLIDITSATGASIFAGSSQSGQATITGFSNEATITTDKTDISTENIKGDETDATLTVGDNRELVISGMGAADKLIHVAQDGGTSLKTFTFDGTNAYNFIESAATSLGTSDNDSVVVTDGKDFDGSQGGNDRFILNGSASVTLGTGSNSVISGASNLTNTIILTGGNDTITDSNDAVLTINFNATNETAYIDKFSTNDLIVAGKLTGLDKASEITISDTATDNRYLMTIGENKAYFDSDTKAVKVMDSDSTATLKNYALDGGKWYNVIEEKNAKDADDNLASIVGSTGRDSITATNININTARNVNTYTDNTDGDIINVSGAASVITGATYDTINTSGSDVISIVSGGNDLIDGTGTRYINATGGGAVSIGTAISDDDTIQVNVTGLNNAAQVKAEDADNTGDTKLTIGTQVMSIAGGASHTIRVADSTGESLQTIVKVDDNYYNYIEGANAADDTGAKVSIVGTTAQDSIVASDLDIDVSKNRGTDGDIIEATATNSNVNITGGSLADTITAKGAKDINITAGDGNDSIVIDSSVQNITINAGDGANEVVANDSTGSNVYIITPDSAATNTLNISSFNKDTDRFVISDFTGIANASNISATADTANKAINLKFTNGTNKAEVNVTLANAIDDSIKIYDKDNDDLVKVVKYNTNTSNFQNVIVALNAPQDDKGNQTYIKDSTEDDYIEYTGATTIDATAGGDDEIIAESSTLIKLGAGENTLTATDVIQIDVSAGTNAINATNTSTQTTISLTGGVNTLTLSGSNDTIISSNTTDTLTGGSARTISVSGSTNGAFTVTDLNTATDSDTIVTDIATYENATNVQAEHNGTTTTISIKGGATRTITAENYNKSNILVLGTKDGDHFTLKNLKYLKDASRYVNYIENSSDATATTLSNDEVLGTADDDYIVNKTNATIIGVGGKDSITSTADDVTIDLTATPLGANSEADSVVSTGSNVLIKLGAVDGNIVEATGDENTIIGGSNIDNITLTGSDGVINLGAGDDVASISGDNNTISAAGDKNEIHVLGINNVVNLGSGSDTVYTSKSADKGNDTYEGYITINAGSGNDTIKLDDDNAGSGSYVNRIIQADLTSDTLYVEDYTFGGGETDGDIISLKADYSNIVLTRVSLNGAGTNDVEISANGSSGKVYLKGAKLDTIRLISPASLEGSGLKTSLYKWIDQLDKFLPTYLNKNGSSAQDFVQITENIDTDATVISAGNGNDLVEVNAQVILDAGKGADTVNVYKTATATPEGASVSGGDDADVMINTADAVFIDGGDGNDLILNENAAATLSGGSGSISGQDTIITTQYALGNDSPGSVTIMSTANTEYVSNGFTSGRYIREGGIVVNREVDGTTVNETITAANGDTDTQSGTVTVNATSGATELAIGSETRTLVNNRTFYIDGSKGGSVVIEDYNTGDTIVVGTQSDSVTTNNYTKVTGKMTEESKSFGNNLVTFDIGIAHVYLKNATDKKIEILEFKDDTKHDDADKYNKDSNGDLKTTTYQYAEGIGVVQVTALGDNDSFSGREIADSIDVYGEGATVYTGAGNNVVNILGNNASVTAGEESDRITNLANETTIDAGDGQDNIYSHGTAVSIYAGQGANNIYLTQLADQTPDETVETAAVTVGGGTQNDYIANTFFGFNVHDSEGNSTVQTVNDDKVTRVTYDSDGEVGTSLSGSISTETGDPILIWDNNTTDTMIYNRVITYEGGVDEVADYHSTDRIVLTNSAYITDKYRLTTSGTDAVLNIDGNNKLTLKDATDKVITVTDASDKEIKWLYSGTEFMQVIEIDSTGKVDPENASPTSNADSINVSFATLVSAGAGNDIINADAEKVTVDAGAGADTVNSTGDEVSIVGGADNDVIRAAGNKITLDGGDGNDSLITALTEDKTATIIADSGYNTISNQRFDGDGIVAETETGSNGNTVEKEVELTYNRAISLGAGNNVITDFASSDTLGGVLSANGIVTINNSDVKLTTSVTGSTGNTTLVGGRDKDISIISALDSDGRPALFRYYEADNKFVRVYNDDDLDNSKLNVTDNFNASINVTTQGAEINASNGADYIWNSGAEATISAGTNDDFIVNTGASAVISAGDGADVIISAANDASINGGAGKDSIIAISYINPTLDSGSAVSVGAGATIEVGTENDYVGNVSDQVTLGTSTVEEKDSTGNVTNSYTLTTIASGRNDSVIIRTYKNNDFTTAESDDTYQANGGRTLDIKAATSGANTMAGFMENDTIHVDTDVVTAKLNGRDVVLTFNKSTVTLTDASDKHIHIAGKEEDSVMAFVDGKFTKIVEDAVAVDVDQTTGDSIMTGSDANESINVSVQGAVTVNANAGNDTVNVYTTLSADNAPVATIVGGAGDDVINLMNYNVKDIYKNSNLNTGEVTNAKGAAVIVMSGADGKDTVNYFDENSELVFSEVTPAKTATTSGGNVTFTVGTGSLTLTDAATKEIKVTVLDSEGKVVSSTSQVYGTDTATVTTDNVFENKDSALYYDASFNNALKNIDASTISAEITIKGNDNANTIYGGTRESSLIGGSGTDVFVINGNSNIADIDNNETVIFTSAITGSEVNGSDVKLTYTATDEKGDTSTKTVTLANGTKHSIVAVTSIMPETGATDTDPTVSSAVRYYNTDGKATLIATANSSDAIELQKGDEFDVVNASARKTGIAISAEGQETKAISMVGGSGADSLVAGTKGGQLNGGAGNDTLVGGTGTVTMTGGAGNDVFAVSSDALITDYTANADYISISSNSDADVSDNSDAGKSGIISKNVTLNTGNGTVTITNGQGKRLAFIQDLDTSDDAYATVGDNPEQTILLTPIIQTSASVKSIQALNADGASKLIYDARVNAANGVTSIDASKRSYDNIIYVNNLADAVVTVKGGTKADTIIGGTGDNLITGGAGSDVFMYSGGNDTITDYTPVIDAIRFTAGYTATGYHVDGSDVILEIATVAEGVTTASDQTLTIAKGKNKDITLLDSTGEDITSNVKKKATFVDVKEYIYTKPGDNDVDFGSAIETVNAAKVTNASLKYDMHIAEQSVLYTGSGKADSIITSAHGDTIKTGGGNDTVVITASVKAGDTTTYNNGESYTYENATSAEDVVIISDYTAGKDVIQLGTYTVDGSEVNDYISGIATVATSVTSGKKTTVTKDLELTTASGRTVKLTSKNTAAVTVYDNNYGEYKVQAKKSGTDIVTTLTLTANTAKETNNVLVVDGSAGYATINGSGLAKTKHIDITGSTNDEWIKGGKGDDVLNGGGGNDTLTGGSGSDTFKISALTNGDTLTITDYTAGQDTIHLASTIAVVDSTIVKKNVQLTLLDTDTSAKSTLVLTNGKGKAVTVTDDNNDTSTIIYGEGYATLKPNGTTQTVGDATTNPRYNLVKAIDVSASKATGNIAAVSNNVNDTYYSASFTGLGTILKGGSKEDTLVGSNNNDTFTGGAKNDVFVRGAGSAAYDVITDYAAGDVIDVASLASAEIKSVTLASSLSDTTQTVGLTKTTIKKTPVLQVGDNGYIQLNNASGKKVTIKDVNFTDSLLLGDGATLQPALSEFTANGISTIDASKHPNYVNAIDASKATSGSRQVYIIGGNTTDNDKMNMLLKGGAYADTIISSSGSDTMTGGKGNDVFVHGGDGNGTGHDVITDYAVGDVISLTGGAKSIDSFDLNKNGKSDASGKDVKLVIGSGSVVVQNGKGKKIKISDQPAGIIFGADSTGATLSITATDVNNNGRDFSNNYYEKVTAIDGSAVAASAGGLILSGNSHNNIIKGSKGADYISDGGGSQNTMTGGAGNDTFSWAGSSDDTITDYAAGDVIEFTGGGQSNYTVETSGTLKNAVIFNSGSNKLTVLNGKNKKFTFGDGSTNTIKKSSDAAYVAPTVEIVEDTTYEADLTSAVKAADTTTTVTSAVDTADTVASAAAYVAPVINAVEAQEAITPTWFTADDTLTADDSAVSNLVDTSTAATTDLAVTSTPTAVDPTSLTTSTSDLATTSLSNKKTTTK